MKVLFLSSWYPSEKDAMFGLFVQKHVQALRLCGMDVRVLGVDSIEKGWKPDVIQLNILSLKNALRTYWLHKRYGVPYVIVEHWSRYLPAHFSFPKGIEGGILKFVAKRAKVIMPVSERLGEAMRRCGIQNGRWEKVNNVVDDFFFEDSRARCKKEKKGRTELLHVSCFDEDAKNTKGILRAYRQAKTRRGDLHLTMVGTGKDWEESRNYAQAIGLSEDDVRWTGELSPDEVSKEMQSADCFVLFSRYENAPVVLSECLASGLPIISSEVGGIAEMVSEDCGVLVRSEDEKGLEDAMVSFDAERYDEKKIQKHGEQYRGEKVGEHLIAIYQSVLS